MSDPDTAITIYERPELAETPPAIEAFLARIRPEWQATPLVRRVKRLLAVDESSACQRLLNAAGHDLRAKIKTLGVDLAGEAAKTFKLPRVDSDEDLEDYPTARLYDLSYRLGLVNRAEWRRLHRSYEIRRDLEHEDDEYEASIGDLVYIFETAIDIVLSRDPTQVIQLADIQDVVESTGPVTVPADLIQDFTQAPSQRQSEIFHRLVFWSLDEDRPEVVRSNCYRLVRQFEPITPNSAKIELAKKFEARIGRRSADLETAHITLASGAYPFVRRRQQKLITAAFIGRFDDVGHSWRHHHEHAELLDDFAAAGGFGICPPGTDRRIVRWMIHSYIGEPGRYGTWGRNRAVFYSDTAAPRIEKLLREPEQAIVDHAKYVANEGETEKLLEIPEQEARLSRLLDSMNSE